MKQLFLLAVLAVFSTALFGQKITMSKASDSDPEAKAILDKVKQKYDSYKSIEADFSLSIEVPEQPKEVQKGKLSQQGNNYRLEMEGQTVISDGKTTWLYLPTVNEVQINDADLGDDKGIYSPKDILTIYEKGEFVYALTNEFAKDGKLVQQIEFKPLKKGVEYSKLRLSVDKKTNDIISVEAFIHDGSRYTLQLTKLTPNKTFTASTFTFDKSKYPNVYVEDLRG